KPKTRSPCFLLKRRSGKLEGRCEGKRHGKDSGRRRLLNMETLKKIQIVGLTSVLFAVSALVSAPAFGQNGQAITSKAISMKPPEAKVAPVTDDYHGHKVSDPYRWLEDANSPETKSFVAEQNSYTQKALDALPGKDQLRARIEQL